MRIESPDGYTVNIVDGNGRSVFSSDTAGAITLPAATAASMSVTGAVVAPAFVPQASAVLSLTAAQVNTLYTTGVDLVAAPAAGYALVFDGAVVYYVYGSAAFTIGSATGLAVRYTDKTGTQVAQCAVTGVLDQSADQIRWVRPWTAASGASNTTPTASATLNLSMLGANTSVGTGCVLKVQAYYRVVPTTL